MNYKNKYERESTFIRNLYSPGYSSILISFYKVNLSLLFQPFERIDPRNGRDTYGKRGVMTTITYEGAAALYFVAHDILFGNNPLQEVTLTIQCAGSATLVLERVLGQGDQPETFLVVTKNNETIAFKFNTIESKVRQNGQNMIRVIDAGLIAFYKILIGYLTGINASGHLNKLGDDLEALQDEWQHMTGQQANNPAGNNSQGNVGQLGNNITYQVQANNNQYAR